MRYALTGLEQGYETYLGKQCGVGTNLSGGEWQRAGLSRAYMRDAGVVSRCGRLTSRYFGTGSVAEGGARAHLPAGRTVRDRRLLRRR